MKMTESEQTGTSPSEEVAQLREQVRELEAKLKEASARAAAMPVTLSLQASEERFRQLVNQLQVGVLTYRPNGQIIFANPAAQELLGMTEPQLLARKTQDSFWDVIHEDGSPFDSASLPANAVLATGQAVHNVVMGVYRPYYDDRVWLLSSCEPQLSPTGEIEQAITTVSDITTRIQVEKERAERLQEQTARREAEEARNRQTLLSEASKMLAGSLDYEKTLQTVAQMVVPAMADWCSVHIVESLDIQPQQVALVHKDPAMVEWAIKLGQQLDTRYPYDPNAPTGMPLVIRSALPEMYPDIPDEMLVAVAQDEEMLQLFRSIGYSSVMIVPMVARDRVLGVIQFVTTESGRHYDQTDLDLALELAQRAAVCIDNARLYRNAQAAIRTRDEFLSVAAHELKTPVTSMRGYAQLLTRQLVKGVMPEPERLKRTMEIIDQQSGKLAHLITQLLDISRLEMGQLTLNRETTDLIAIVESVITNARVTTSRHNLTMVGPQTLVAWVDPVRIEQVITNLVTNAVKYSPNGGDIEIELVELPPTGQIKLSVRDQGIGIELEHRERIFERFYQARPEDRTAGVGLGLYISRQIVELHGGTIEVDIPAQGGTRMTVVLPTTLVTE